jgi:hypothetical protein
MSENPVMCSRCGATVFSDASDWLHLDVDSTLQTVGVGVDGFDLCDSCAESFFVWLYFRRLDDQDLEAFRAAEGLGEYSE